METTREWCRQSSRASRFGAWTGAGDFQPAGTLQGTPVTAPAREVPASCLVGFDPNSALQLQLASLFLA